MKTLKWALAMLAAASLLAGCKGFWKALPSTGGTGAASGVFYVLNTGQQQVAGFSFATGSTSPTAVTGSPYALGAAPLAAAISPGGGVLYISTGGGILAYSVGSGGDLTALGSSQVLTNDPATAMAMDGTGAWLIESVAGSGVLTAIPIDSSTGLVDSTRSTKTATLPKLTLNQIAVSPANSSSPYVFAAMGTGGVAAIPFTANATGTPFGTVSNPIGVLNSSGADVALAVDPSNRLLYVGETTAFQTGKQTGGLRVFAIASTSVKEVTGSPYQSGGTGPSAILATANFVYVANKVVSGSSTGNISGYPVVDTAGVYSLGTLINTVTAGDNTAALAEDSTSTYLLAVNSAGNPDLSAFTFDATTTGKLDVGPTATTGTDPTQATAIVAVP